jgi:hypothetical protein
MKREDMKKLYSVQVKKTYDVVVYCEKDEAEMLALDSFLNENEEIETLGPYSILVPEDLPEHRWLESLPYRISGDGSNEKTVGVLLAEMHG